VKLVDTTVAVDHLRGLPAATDLLSDLISSGEEVVANELVRFELLSGVRHQEELEALEEFFSALTWVAVDAEISRVGGFLARQHRRSHSGIGDVDYLIAATAVVLDAELLTTNIRHFPMLEGLRAPY
jgi:predicted nucleic acid-binding protein